MPAAARTCVSGANFSQIGEAGLEVPAGLDAAKVDVVTVGADDVLAFAQRLVGDHLDLGADRTDRAAARAEGLADLVGFRGTEVVAKLGEQLHLVQPVV